MLLVGKDETVSGSSFYRWKKMKQDAGMSTYFQKKNFWFQKYFLILKWEKYFHHVLYTSGETSHEGCLCKL